MVSGRGRIFRNIIRMTFNLNPHITADPVKKLRVSSERIINDDVPDGFTLYKHTTLNGTKYERVLMSGENHRDRVLLYLHGGAYVAGLLNVYRDLAVDFYDAAEGCEMILLDYELAPENVYPSQLNEVVDLWEELVERQGYKPENIVIVGDSAGANLAVSLMLKLRDCGKALPKAAVCMSLWGDMTCSGDSFVENYTCDVMFGRREKFTVDEIIEEQKSLINSKIFAWFGEADRSDPYVSPTLGEFHGFPPMFFTVGEDEILKSDTLTVAEKLKNLGIYSEVDIGEGMFHVYPIFRAIVPEGKASFDKILNFIKRVYKDELV